MNEFEYNYDKDRLEVKLATAFDHPDMLGFKACISTVFIQDGFHEGNTWVRLREMDTTEDNPDHDSEVIWDGIAFAVDERPIQ